MVQNGLSLRTINQIACDRNRIGMTPDCEVKVQEDVPHQFDRPKLKSDLQSRQG